MARRQTRNMAFGSPTRTVCVVMDLGRQNLNGAKRMTPLASNDRDPKRKRYIYESAHDQCWESKSDTTPNILDLEPQKWQMASRRSFLQLVSDPIFLHSEMRALLGLRGYALGQEKKKYIQLKCLATRCSQLDHTGTAAPDE